MSDTKQAVLEALRELSELTLLDEGDPQSFRLRAYENAMRAVSEHSSDIGLLSAKELQKIEGIGKSTAEKIRQIVDTGKMDKLEMLRGKYPASLVALMRIQGLGPKAVRRLHTELGVQSLDDLRRVLDEHKVQALKGFGTKSEQKIADSIRRLEAQGAMDRTPISVALPLAERIAASLLEVPGVTDAIYCGSLRRFSETVGDIDIVVAAANAPPVMEALVRMPFVDRVLGGGDTKTSIVTRRGTQVDVRVVPKKCLGAALLYFTGSKAHNVKLRQRALTRGWTLNEYALSELEGGKVIASETEAQIYEALGLSWIPPVLREDVGEIDAAEGKTLPPPLARLTGDFHVHTSVSGDGQSTLVEMIMAALARDCGILAITDHAEGAVAGVGRERLLEQRAEIAAAQKELGDKLTLLHGVELNIGREGELDYDLAFRRRFDFCLASVHDHFDLDRTAQTQRIIKAMEDPTVRMIGHLSARMIGARPGIDLDLDAVFDAAERTDTALEVNGGLPRLDVSVEALKRARGRNLKLVLTSDAHHASELGRVEYAARNAERAWINPSQVVNCWPRDKLMAWAKPADRARARV